MDAKIFILLLFGVLVTVAASHSYRRSRYCSLRNNYYRARYYSYCSRGCCTYKCCGDYDVDIDYSLGAGAIFGIVIGSLISVVILVSLIVCCVVVACRKSRGHQGVVVHPNPMIVMNTYPNVQYYRTDYPLPPYGNFIATTTTTTTNTQPSAPYPEATGIRETTFSDPPPSYSQSQRMKY